MYQNILVPIDPAHGEVSDRILSIAKRLVDDDGTVTALSVIEPMPTYLSGHIHDETLEGRIKANWEGAMTALHEAMDRAGVTGKAVLDEGSPSPEILRVAEEIKADAIVLGSHRPGLRDYLLGSTASRIVRHAQCTVIVERSTPVQS
ncbi:MAG: universal stress protein [Pseudomonadota bacterium]